MKQILVLIENELEQSITGDILRSGLGAEAEITLTAGAEQAIQQLQSGAVDLFIADVERFDVAHCNMVTTARKTAPDTPILVTSVGTQEEIAGYVWRLGVRDYLLKPPTRRAPRRPGFPAQAVPAHVVVGRGARLGA